MAGTGRTAGRKKRGSGRRFVLALVGIFVLAMGQARALRQLEERRDAMDAARVKLEAEIREASSRARLGPIVEQRLQMYVPADSQVIILPRPPQTHQP
jgi:hypothetical protein